MALSWQPPPPNHASSPKPGGTAASAESGPGTKKPSFLLSPMTNPCTRGPLQPSGQQPCLSSEPLRDAVDSKRAVDVKDEGPSASTQLTTSCASARNAAVDASLTVPSAFESLDINVLHQVRAAIDATIGKKSSAQSPSRRRATSGTSRSAPTASSSGRKRSRDDDEDDKSSYERDRSSSRRRDRDRDRDRRKRDSRGRRRGSRTRAGDRNERSRRRRDRDGEGQGGDESYDRGRSSKSRDRKRRRRDRGDADRESSKSRVGVDGHGDRQSSHRPGEGRDERHRSRDAGDDRRNYKTSSGLSRSDIAEINRKVSDRNRARVRKDYGVSDSIRSELWEKYSVVVVDFNNDRTEWHHVPERYKRVHVGASPPKMLSKDDIADIENRIAYLSVSDEKIRNGTRSNLWKEYSVVVDDKRKEWYTTNASYTKTGGDNGKKQKVNNRYRRTDLTHGETVDLSDDAVACIHQKIDERWHAKCAKDYRTADAIRVELLKTYSVGIDDRKMEWFVFGGYTQRQGANASLEISDNDVKYIHHKILERAAARARQDFRSSDSIRAELWEKYSIVIYDKEREWCFANGQRAKMDHFASPLEHYESNAADIRQGGANLHRNAKLSASETRSDFRDSGATISDIWKDSCIATNEQRMGWPSTCFMDGDNEKEFHSTDRYRRTEPVYGSPLQLSEDMVACIEQKIDQRSHARHAGDYRTADAIRAELWERHSVFIDDQTMEWYAIRNQPKEGVCGAMKMSADEEVGSIEQEISERSVTQLKTDYLTADQRQVGCAGKLEEEKELTNERISDQAAVSARKDSAVERTIFSSHLSGPTHSFSCQDEPKDAMKKHHTNPSNAVSALVDSSKEKRSVCSKELLTNSPQLSVATDDAVTRNVSYGGYGDGGMIYV